MSTLKVYRIDGSLLGKLFRVIRKSDLPPAAGTATLGGNFARTVTDLVYFENHYVIDNKDELDRFKNPLGNSWSEKEQYYIRHPKQVRERLLIEADKFHEYIVREQISEITSYIRSCFPVKKLSIKVLSGVDYNAFVNVPIEELKIEGNAYVKLKNNREIVIECPEGLKPSQRRTDYVWIDDFSDVKEAIDAFTGGEFRYKKEINNSFGMGLKEANTIGVGADWLKSEVFEISVSS